MGVYVKTPTGERALFDVALFLRDQGLIPIGVEKGNITYKSEDGKEEGVFSIADWAIQNDYTIEKIDGFNTPPSALDTPPSGMNRLDQAVFFMAGKNVNELRDLFPQATQLSDGRVVVLDKDGLWKTMWSDTWEPPQPFPSYDDHVAAGQALDTRVGMKAAGLAFLFGLAGVTPKIKNGDVDIASLEKCLKVIARNCPVENKMILSKFIQQTTGLDSWSFQTALIDINELASWLKQVVTRSSLDFRMRQGEVATVVMTELQHIASAEFLAEIDRLEKVPATKDLVCNMKEVVDEFIMVMANLDVIRDISKISGLDEWKDQAEAMVDQSKLPPMPAFVPRLHKVLQYMLPISKNKNLAFVKGKRGLNAIASMMIMIDKAIYSLSDVPDCSAKQKMMMALKNTQCKFENKLAFYYHPMKDKTGMEVNEFMLAKQKYGPKREVVYKLIQDPKDTWAGKLFENFRREPNLEALYEGLPKKFRLIVQSFVAMQIAYDMQSWVDSHYQKRVNDPFAMHTDLFGTPPPEYGYLADNSPRAALNIIETLAAASAMMSGWTPETRYQVLRSPMHMAQLIDMIQSASIQREVGAVEALSKAGLTHMNDPYRAVDPKRIWEDPVAVQQDIDRQVEEMVAMLAAEQAQKEQAEMAQEQQEVAAAQAQNQAAAEGGGGTGAPMSGPVMGGAA